MTIEASGENYNIIIFSRNCITGKRTTTMGNNRRHDRKRAKSKKMKKDRNDEIDLFQKILTLTNFQTKNNF